VRKQQIILGGYFFPHHLVHDYIPSFTISILLQGKQILLLLPNYSEIPT